MSDKASEILDHIARTQAVLRAIGKSASDIDEGDLIYLLDIAQETLTAAWDAAGTLELEISKKEKNKG